MSKESDDWVQERIKHHKKNIRNQGDLGADLEDHRDHELWDMQRVLKEGKGTSRSAYWRGPFDDKEDE